MSSGGRSTRSPDLPKCPNCQSSRVIRTHEQLGEQLFFCADCEQTSGVRPGKPKLSKT
jgi:transposase-like protein